MFLLLCIESIFYASLVYQLNLAAHEIMQVLIHLMVLINSNVGPLSHNDRAWPWSTWIAICTRWQIIKRQLTRGSHNQPRAGLFLCYVETLITYVYTYHLSAYIYTVTYTYASMFICISTTSFLQYKHTTKYLIFARITYISSTCPIRETEKGRERERKQLM